MDEAQEAWIEEQYEKWVDAQMLDLDEANHEYPEDFRV